MIKNGGLLSAPIRVFWHLSDKSGHGIPRERALLLADELARLKVFYATLRLTCNAGGAGEGERADAAEIMNRLSPSVAHTALSIASPGLFPGWDGLAGIKMLDIYNPLAPGGLKDFGAIVKDAPGGMGLGLTLIPEKGLLNRLVEQVRDGLGLGIETFSLANPDLVHEKEPARFVLSGGDRDYLKHGLERVITEYGGGVRLMVHDLFLHDAIRLPGLGMVEYAGCQAGDAIAFIAPDGTVYPCASFPRALGNVKEQTLKDIWAAEARKELHAEIAALPDSCFLCGMSSDCKGACRGLAFASGGLHLPDPSCGRQ